MKLRFRNLRRDVVTLLLTCSIVFVARASFADHYRVPSGSMEPTVAVGDRIFVDKLAYGLRIPETETYLARRAGPDRGDVVVLSSPDDGEVLLKRVVAVPGDLVQVSAGRVVIDGVAAPVREEAGRRVEALGAHVHEVATDDGGGPDFGPTRVPADRYLVLGDNRGNSRDGRFFGWVARSEVLGRAVAVCAHEGRLVWHPL